MTKKFYVTTPIYYPNDKLHIGHAYTTVLADYINRYKKLQNYETMFITGSDEHGQKIADRSKVAGEDPLTFVTKIISTFKTLWKTLGIENDLFIRTTDDRHKKFVQEIFTNFYNKGFIYKDKYEGLYCKSDEAYFTKTQTKNGKCPICGKDLIKLSEESYFLKVSNFKEWIKNELLTKNILLPKTRVNELINNFVDDLRDLSITRTSFDWGIKINEDHKHVIYVWLDALVNYLSALTYPESKFNIDEVWSIDSDVEILQIIGKEITRFHSIYWPIILKIKNYRSPKVLAHGWLVSDNGDKMSKSKGNGIDPTILINEYGRDSIRFFLVNNISTGEDGKFSKDLLEETINGLLVNKFSNLIARTDSMIKKYFDGVVPKNNLDYKEKNILFDKLNSIKNEYFNTMDKYEFSNSTKLLIKYIEELNGFIDITEPWKKTGEELGVILNTLIKGIFNITILLSSILIDSSELIYNWLDVHEKPKFSDFDRDFHGTKLKDIKHLFTRINKE